MKKISLFLVLWSLISLHETKAQYNLYPPDSSAYDVLYVFDTSFFTNCFMTDNTMRTEFEVSPGTNYQSYYYALPYTQFDWFNVMNRDWCNPNAPVPKGFVIGANCTDDTSAHYAEAFAQECNFDDYDIPYNDYVVCGIAIKLAGSALDDYRKLCILNQNFDTVAHTIFHTTHRLIETGWLDWDTIRWNKWDWNTYYFPPEYYDTLTNINDFYMAFDVPMYGYGNTFRALHTCNVYSPCIRDTIYANGGPFEYGFTYDSIIMGMRYRTQNSFNVWKDSITGEWRTDYRVVQLYLEYLKQFDEEDNIPLCVSGVPKFLKHNGEWINFADDPVYEIWQNIHIAMVPIIMIPQGSQSLSEVELEKMCYVFPNPAKDVFKVMSHYTIKDIQVFDMMGKKVLEKEVNYFETEIIVDNLEVGTYIVKINTSKGTTEKKLIVQ